MRWNEREIEPEKDEKDEKKKPREMKKPGQYDMEDFACLLYTSPSPRDS